jgi:hypothetical protein
VVVVARGGAEPPTFRFSGGFAVQVSPPRSNLSMRTLGGEVVGGRWGRSPVRPELVVGAFTVGCVAVLLCSPLGPKGNAAATSDAIMTGSAPAHCRRYCVCRDA